ncbi:hypothetical protein CEY16_06595 [Halalkalibacillus sediminis]|uniref:Aminoglycoside phosphotransferase domain-containing protein n=1 Tax=Halalkalibacillus sediminis TaxID=2018042 RepID=A0A2I0QTD3_9BACI|nr:aminoglycoside phosphotransferase family protein [Halalkalibacillus sediminis]PKR77602.1 hypothetical protein CEY16_06595 [Halalkalibacillus sediminis]
MTFDSISFLNEYKTAHKINKGFSHDEKWVIDDRYLLRIFGDVSSEQLEEQALLIQKAVNNGASIPNVHELGMYQSKPYMILDYLQGKNAEEVLPVMSGQEQYQAGLDTGRGLQKLHASPVDQPVASWESKWNKRVYRLAPDFESIFKNSPRHLKVLDFIYDQLYLMKDRPQRIQHYDFHPSNVIFNNNRFEGIIDMQKIKLADPYHELYKTEYFTLPISVSFARGIFDGYHDGSVPADFWKLHRLYAAIHIVSAEVWAHNVAIDQKETFRRYTERTLNEWDDFQLDIPKWYTAGHSEGENI